jgi:hypothetical protein
MSYTLKQAEDALDKLTSTGEALKADILQIVKQVSIEAQGVNADATTLLYSGNIERNIGGTVKSSDIIEGMAGDASIRTVDKTIAAELLNSNIFKEKVAKAFGMSLTEFNALPDTNFAKLWLFKDANGSWAAVSEMFIDATTGKVRHRGANRRRGDGHSGSREENRAHARRIAQRRDSHQPVKQTTAR